MRVDGWFANSFPLFELAHSGLERQLLNLSTMFNCQNPPDSPGEWAIQWMNHQIHFMLATFFRQHLSRKPCSRLLFLTLTFAFIISIDVCPEPKAPLNLLFRNECEMYFVIRSNWTFSVESFNNDVVCRRFNAFAKRSSTGSEWLQFV